MKIFLLFALMVSGVQAFELEINIKNIRSSKGNIKVALYQGPKGFPSSFQSAYQTEIVEIQGDSTKHTFRGLVEGDYAIAIFHDLNNNNILDTRFRIPREPFGFSNNPRVTGPPKYSSCRVDLKQDTALDIYLKKIL